MGLSSRKRLAVAASVVAGAFVVISAAATPAFDRRLDSLGRSDLGQWHLDAATTVIVLAIVSSLVVGIALVLRRPEHPVGWLLLGLATCMSISGIIDGYALVGAVARVTPLRSARIAAFVGDVSFIPWLVLVSLVLQLTPTGRTLSRRWALWAWLSVGAGALGMVAGVFSTGPVDPPFDTVTNPLAASPAGAVDLVRAVSVSVVGVALLVGAASIVVRYRRARGVERRQLHWLLLAAVPLVVFVPAAFVAAWTQHPTAVIVATGGFVVLVPVAVGLAITQHHLYDVDRILSRAFTYALLTALLVATYALVVVTAARAFTGWDNASALSAVLGTLAAVSLAAPARRWIQDRLDRRFNRRRFDALQMIRSSTTKGTTSAGLEDTLRRALADPSLCVSYPVEDRRERVTAAGAPATNDGDFVDVTRNGLLVAQLRFDPDVVDRELVEAAGAAAASELDNARLRAEISLQLVEVHESRARIAAAQIAERRKLERNLHDGAQQRLLALAFELQAAQLNGDPDRLRDAVTEAVARAQDAVTELRALANGLNPAVLDDGGLAAALDDLIARTPIPIHLCCVDERLPVQTEVTAWFIVCEAVSNALKHARPSEIDITLTREDGWLDVSVLDDGVGGADASGTGLVGIRDRAEAMGGTIDVVAGTTGGTLLHGRLPCEQ